MSRNVFLFLGITLLAGFAARTAPAAPSSQAAGIDCGQWTAPVDLTGQTATSGPYATRAAAVAAAGRPQTQVQAIADTFWPFFICPGCPDGVPGCDEALQVIQATVVTGAIRKGDAGWYIDYTFTGGLVSMSCDPCPDVGVGIG